MAEMTMKQIQNLLQYHGYYDGIPDGRYGPKTEAATEAFQKAYSNAYGSIGIDGKPGQETQKALRHAVAYGLPEVQSKADTDFWPDIEYFDREEFRCTCGKCGGFPVEPEEKLVRTVDEIRRRLGVPVSIVDKGGSGVRCPKHNTAVGGAANSQHLYGRAADLHSGKSPEEMREVAEAVLGNTGGIGIYKWGIHVDVRGQKARWDER